MAFLVAALGLAIGSFLNVVIFRLRTDEKGWRDRSICPECRTILKPKDLIPILSFLILRGRCRECKKPISWQYLLVELSTMLLFLAAFALHGGAAVLSNGQAFAFVRDLFFIAILTVVFVIDLLDMVVFDSVTLPGIVVALIFNVALGMPIGGLLLAAAIGGGFFLLQWLVSRGRWIGGGDIRIGAMMGAMLGFPAIVAALLVAYVIGALVATILLSAKKTTWTSHMAFGTFLSVATIIVMLWGNRLWIWYVSLL